MSRALAFVSIILVAAGLAAAMGLSDLAERSEARERRVTITGSSTVAPLAGELAARMEAGSDNLRIDVQAGGSSRGLADVRKGLADIGMVSRGLTESESDFIGHVIARDGIAMIVHESNLRGKITSNEVTALYNGETTNWSALGGLERPVTLVHKADGRATQQVFLRHFALDNAEIDPDVVAGHNQQAIKTVAASDGAIGYVSIGAAEAAIEEGAAIKMLTLDGIEPTQAAVAGGRYPLARELTLVTGGSPEGAAADFIALAQSPRAAEIIEKAGFVPPRR